MCVVVVGGWLLLVQCDIATAARLSMEKDTKHVSPVTLIPCSSFTALTATGVASTPTGTHVIDRRVSRAVAKWKRRLMRNWSVREKKRLGHFRTRSTVITPLVHSPNSNTKRCKHLRSSVCWLVLSCVVAPLLRVMA